MDDGESGMKEPPEKVKILFKRVCVRIWAHTVYLISKENCPLFLVSLDHALETK